MVIPLIVTSVFALALAWAFWFVCWQGEHRGPRSRRPNTHGSVSRQARVTAIERRDARTTVRVRLRDEVVKATEHTFDVAPNWPGLSDLSVGSVTVVDHPWDAPGQLQLVQRAPIVTVSIGVIARG